MASCSVLFLTIIAVVALIVAVQAHQKSRSTSAEIDRLRTALDALGRLVSELRTHPAQPQPVAVPAQPPPAPAEPARPAAPPTPAPAPVPAPIPAAVR